MRADGTHGVSFGVADPRAWVVCQVSRWVVRVGDRVGGVAALGSMSSVRQRTSAPCSPRGLGRSHFEALAATPEFSRTVRAALHRERRPSGCACGRRPPPREEARRTPKRRVVERVGAPGRGFERFLAGRLICRRSGCVGRTAPRGLVWGRVWATGAVGRPERPGERPVRQSTERAKRLVGPPQLVAGAAPRGGARAGRIVARTFANR